MNSHRVEVFDGTDYGDIVFAIAKQLKFVFFPTQNGLLHQYFMDWAALKAIL